MNLSDIIRLSFRSLRQRRLRSALTILGIVVGAGLVVGLISVSHGVERGIFGELDKLGTDVIMVYPASHSTKLTSVDERLISRISQVKHILPIYAGYVQISAGRKSQQLELIGVDQSAFKNSIILKGLNIEQGTVVSHFDANGIVLGAKVANPPGTDAPFARLNQAISVEASRIRGDEVEVTKRTFIVRGIAEEYGPSLISVDNQVFTSLDAARTLFGYSSFSMMFVVARSTDQVEPVISRLEEMYGDDIEIVTMQQILEIVNSINGMITLFLGGIAAVSLFVAGIGIANIMFVSVMERTREIGVLKALGFKRTNILLLFLSEAFLTGLIGGIIGCGLGILLGYGVTGFLGNSFMVEGSGATSINPVFSMDMMILAIGFAVIIAVIAGFYPSWKASRKHPIDALRSE